MIYKRLVKGRLTPEDRQERLSNARDDRIIEAFARRQRDITDIGMTELPTHLTNRLPWHIEIEGVQRVADVSDGIAPQVEQIGSANAIGT